MHKYTSEKSNKTGDFMHKKGALMPLKLNFEDGKYRLYNENNELLGERDTAQEILILFTSISGYSWRGGKK